MKNLKQTNVNIERYTPTTASGLSTCQVNERLKNGLKNTVSKKLSKSYLNILAGNLCTVFNLLGLIVAVALIFAKAPLSDFFFVVIYVANIGIGIIQELRAKKCIDKLSILTSKTTKVIRESQTLEISSEEIVLDDVIKLTVGNQVPTDCKILDGEIEVNEALLTGESVPVKKKVGDELLAGSFIVGGNCLVIAHKVGKENYIEKLSEKAKQYKKPRSEIMNSLKFIIKLISCIIVPLAIALMVKAYLTPNFELPTAIKSTATSIIGMIPSGMFLLTSLALAVGIINLAKHKTLVQDLYSLEMLARVDTVCFDKTGTITDGKMTVNEYVSLTNDQENQQIISKMVFALKDNNQTAQALKNYFGENKADFIKVLPFNSARKYAAVTFNDNITHAYGAPEFVLDQSEYQKIKQTIESYAQKGLRVLVHATTNFIIEEDKKLENFIPVGLIIIADNVRKEAIDTIKWFKDNGVTVKVISGDNPITVSEVSRRVGIENADKYISLEGLTDEQVASVANEYTVFGRVSPEQKAILVNSMKNAGHTTAMTGDGVNDILALKEADCAISVAEGSDAARNVSHLVLMDNNFNSLPKVVKEGRRVINNVESSASLFLMKTIFTMVMTIITLFLFESYPFRLSNMILLEVFVIGLPSFFLSFQPNESRVDGKFIKKIAFKSIPSAIMMILSVVAVICFGNVSTNTTYKTLAVFALTFAGIISLFNICSPLNLYRSILFFLNLLIVVIGTVLILTNPAISEILTLTAFVPIENYLTEILLLLSIIILNVPLSFILKKLFDKLNKNR